MATLRNQKMAGLCLLLLVLAGCRVTSPQPTLRQGAHWFPPTFPYLRGLYHSNAGGADVHDLQYYHAGYSDHPTEFVTGPPEHYHLAPDDSNSAQPAQAD